MRKINLHNIPDTARWKKRAALFARAMQDAQHMTANEDMEHEDKRSYIADLLNISRMLKGGPGAM